MQPGELVTIRANDAKVKPGSTGRFIGISEASGNLLVDVDGRGRVAFTKDSVVSMGTNGHAAATVAQRTTASNGQAAEKVKLARALYLDSADTAAELGCTIPQLKAMADLLGVGTCRGTGSTCHYTYREIVRLVRFREFMQSVHTRSPKMAYGILAKVREMTGRDPLVDG